LKGVVLMKKVFLGVVFILFFISCMAAADTASDFNKGVDALNDGHSSAQHNLGVMYDKGRGVPIDYTEAAKWYRKAAEHGDPAAQYNLGLMYGNGNGVPQNDQMAYVWLTIAIRALQGEELKYAKESRDFAATKLSPEQLAEAQKISSEWKPK